MLSFYLSALESAADKEDFRALYRRYHGVMERTALAILPDPRDAEEAVQEAFIRVIENFSKIYEIPCKNLGAWLVTIVRNEAITMLRRRRDHLPLDEDWAGFERQARDAPDYASLVALLDAAAQEAEALPQEPPELSPRHGRSMRAMLRDPLAWARSRRRPALRTAARHAAAVLLMLVLSAAVLVTVSPQVQADITRWVAEQTGNVLDFQFRGDSPAQPIPQYQITALPEGYVETERTDSFAAGNVTYKNSDGDMILLSYTYMHDGAHDGFILDNTDTVSDIRVSGMPGKLILSSLEDHDSYVTWIDGASNMQFTVSAAIDEVSIIAIAESVSLCNSTK